MRLTSRLQRISTLGFGMMGTVLAISVVTLPRQARHELPERPGPLPFPTSPAAAALRSARWSRMLALVAANHDREMLAEWDEKGTATLNFEQLRLQLLSRDRTGNLARARREAHRAAALAQSAEEAARAAEQLAMIEHDLDHHAAELHHARRQAALQPECFRARILLRRALRCNEWKGATGRARRGHGEEEGLDGKT